MCCSNNNIIPGIHAQSVSKYFTLHKAWLSLSGAIVVELPKSYHHRKKSSPITCEQLKEANLYNTGNHQKVAKIFIGKISQQSVKVIYICHMGK